jgi:hypothetical protein
MASAKQPGIRRSFEDEFATVKSDGVDAVPSYGHPEDGPVEEPRLREAVRRSVPDAHLIHPVRRIRRPQILRRLPDTLHYHPPWARLYRGYSAAWLPSFTTNPTTVCANATQSSSLETSLYDTQEPAPVWSGTVETTRASAGTRSLCRYGDGLSASPSRRLTARAPRVPPLHDDLQDLRSRALPERADRRSRRHSPPLFDLTFISPKPRPAARPAPFDERPGAVQHADSRPA